MSDLTKLTIRVEKKEIEMIDKFAEARSMSRSDYIRKKLFFDNIDIDYDKKTYVTPPQSYHEILVASLLLKLDVKINEVLKNQGKSVEELEKANKGNDQFVKERRKTFGYDVIKKNIE